MGFSRSFTREQVLAGLSMGNIGRFTRPYRTDESINELIYFEYTKAIEGTLVALDVIAGPIYECGTVWLDSLSWENFSLRKVSVSGLERVSFIEGKIASIGKSKNSEMYNIKFCEFVERSIIRHSAGEYSFFKECHMEHEKTCRTFSVPFTLSDLRYCMDFRSFDTERRKIYDDGYILPGDFTNRVLVGELLEEGKKTGTTLPVDMKTILRPDNRTKYDIVSQRGRLKSIPKSVNRYPLAVGYVMRRALAVVGVEGLARFEGNGARNLIRQITSHCSFDFKPWNTGRLTRVLDIITARHLYPGIDLYVARKYLELCRKNGTRADLSIRKEHTMLQAIHGMTPEKELDRKLKIDNVFRTLEKNTGGSYVLLRTVRQMEEEALRQHNCVDTYIDAVDRGLCAIFTHDNGKGRHFTAEVRFESGRYVCCQFSGFSNTPDPEEEKAFVSLLDGLNEKAEEERRRRLHETDRLVSDPVHLEKKVVGYEYDTNYVRFDVPF